MSVIRNLSMPFVPPVMWLILAAALLSGCAIADSIEPYHPTLSAQEAAQMPPETVARTLIDRYLHHYTTGPMPRRLGLRQYEIHDVDLDRMLDDGFVATVSYSVRPVWTLGNSDWIAGNGVYEGGWVRQKFAFVTIVPHNGGYRWAGMGTGP
ncbi:MAG TPA: hypothetical protein GX702_01825 [Chloroflexi bacterium]|jgi:hypothetical protein|nr:hypothetical protein [Chloroflexota bacterium]